MCIQDAVLKSRRENRDSRARVIELLFEPLAEYIHYISSRKSKFFI